MDYLALARDNITKKYGYKPYTNCVLQPKNEKRGERQQIMGTQ